MSHLFVSQCPILSASGHLIFVNKWLVHTVEYILRVSKLQYLFGPLQQLLSPSASDNRPWSHRHLLWSTQAEHKISHLICTSVQSQIYCILSQRRCYYIGLWFHIITSRSRERMLQWDKVCQRLSVPERLILLKYNEKCPCKNLVVKNERFEMKCTFQSKLSLKMLR